ncbi:MAG: hypothetical protein COS14_07475, partial [Bacteroidetes bacterium CG02_land_8_20_14_3_00_31_25]
MKKFNLLFVAIFFVINGISQNVTLEDAWLTYKFYPSSLDDIASMKDGESYTLLLPNNNIEKYSYKSGKKTSVLFSLSQLKDTDTKPTKIENYTFSDNENKILISSDKQ